MFFILWVVLKGRGLLVSTILTLIEMRQICKICPRILQQVMPSREAAHIKYNHQIISCYWSWNDLSLGFSTFAL